MEAAATTPAVAPRAAARDIAIQIVGRVLNLALGVVVTALVVRTLGQEAYGQWSTILVVVVLTDYATSFGLEPTTVRLAAGHPERERQWVSAYISLRILIAVPSALLAAAIILALQSSSQMLIAGMILATTIVLGAPNAVRVIFQLRVRNDVTIGLITLNTLLWGVSAIALATRDGTMVMFAVAFAGAALITSVGYVIAARRLVRIELRGAREHWGRLLRLGLPVGLTGLLILSYGRLDQIILFELAGARDAGLYAAVYRIIEQAAFVPIALMTTLMPLMAAAWPHDRAHMARLAQVAAEILAVASLGGLAVAIACAEPLTVLLFGEEFRPASQALPVMCGTFVFISLGYLAGNLIIVLGLQNRFLRLALIALVFNVGLNLALVGRYGFMAAAWLALATEALVNVPAMIMVLRRTGIRPEWSRLVRVAGSAVLLVAALEAAQLLGAPLGILLALAVALYPALLLTTRGVELATLKALVRRRL